MNTLVRYSTEEPTPQPAVSAGPKTILNETTSTTVTQSTNVAPSTIVTQSTYMAPSTTVTSSLSVTSSSFMTSLESQESRLSNKAPAVQTMDTA